MPTVEQIQLRIEAEAKGVEEARARVDGLKQEIAALDAEYQSGAKDIGVYIQQSAALAGQLARQQTAVTTHQRNVDRLTTSMATARTSTGTLGLGFLELSRAFEDAQYGLRGVLNNIPTTIQLFGGPAGLAAAVSATAVALTILGPRIRGLLGDFDETVLNRFSKGLEDLKEKLKLLEEKPHKIAVDYQQIEAARKEVAELEKNLQAFQAAADKTPEAEKAAKAAAEAIQEYGGTKVGAATGLAAVARPELEPQTAAGQRLGAAQAELARLEKVTPETYEEQVALIARREALRDEIAALPTLIKKEVMELADARVGAALRGNQAAIAELRRAFEQRPEPFLQAGAQPLFGFALGQATLPEIRGRAEEQQEIARQQRMHKLEADLVRQQEQEEKRRGDAAERINREAARAAGLQQQDREKADREAQRAQDERAREAKQDIDQLMKGVEPTDIGERAALESARMRAQGGVVNRFGNVQRLTEEQQRLLLRRQIASELQQAMPGLTRPQLAGLTGRVAEQAETQAGRVQGQQRAAIIQQARVTGQTLNAGQLNVMATQRTLMLLQGLIPRVEAVEQAAMANLRRAEQMQARAKPAARRAR